MTHLANYFRRTSGTTDAAGPGIAFTKGETETHEAVSRLLRLAHSRHTI
jgi:hypothetical protein